MNHHSPAGYEWRTYLGGKVKLLRIEDPMAHAAHLTGCGVLRLEQVRLITEVERLKAEPPTDATRKAILSTQRALRKTTSLLMVAERHLAEMVGPRRTPTLAEEWAARQPKKGKA
jgi:hypothetical protein